MTKASIATKTTMATTVKHVERLLKRLGPVITIRATDPVAEAARKMAQNDVGCLLVLDPKSQVVGIVTERDIVRKTVARGVNPARATVAAIMNRNVVSCGLGTSIAKARRLMTSHGIRHLPIIEDDVPVGMLSSRDLLAFQLSHTKSIARRQSALLDTIARKHPDVVEWHRDSTGRILID